MKIVPISVTLIDSMGSDLSVVNAARVSFDKRSEFEESGDGYSWVLPDKDTKLIKYLAKHKHTSPFNHCFASFRVKAPIFVSRQLVKHKFMPWNEVSRRYVDNEPEFYFPEGWRLKADNVKQGSAEEYYEGIMSTPTGHHTPKSVVTQCLSVYQYLISQGICAEQARMVLPQNTMTEWIWSGSLGAIADMCKLRLSPYTQKETKQVADLISKEMVKLYPVAWTALMENP